MQELAAQKGVTMAQITLAWLFDRDAVEALEIDLSESDVEWLEAPYEPLIRFIVDAYR